MQLIVKWVAMNLIAMQLPTKRAWFFTKGNQLPSRVLQMNLISYLRNYGVNNIAVMQKGLAI